MLVISDVTLPRRSDRGKPSLIRDLITDHPTESVHDLFGTVFVESIVDDDLQLLLEW